MIFSTRVVTRTRVTGINDDMVKSSNTSAVAAATGRSWNDWIARLNKSDARRMNHTQIAALALELMPETVEQKEWWAQHTAVAFGQHAGLRVPGQTSTGDFQLSTTRTVPGNMDEVLQAWLELVESHTEFGGVPLEGEPTTSSTDRWRYWRVALADGSRVVISISNKRGGKSTVGLQHSKLKSAEAIQSWRPVWKELLAQL